MGWAACRPYHPLLHIAATMERSASFPPKQAHHTIEECQGAIWDDSFYES